MPFPFRGLDFLLVSWGLGVFGESIDEATFFGDVLGEDSFQGTSFLFPVRLYVSA